MPLRAAGQGYWSGLRSDSADCEGSGRVGRTDPSQSGLGPRFGLRALPDAAVADPPVPSGEPGNAAFDHGPVLPVNRLELRCFGLTAGGTEQRLVRVDVDDPSTGAGGALHAQRASVAARTEDHRAALGDEDVDPADGGLVVVDAGPTAARSVTSKVRLRVRWWSGPSRGIARPQASNGSMVASPGKSANPRSVVANVEPLSIARAAW